jgi:hypothetical protein
MEIVAVAVGIGRVRDLLQQHGKRVYLFLSKLSRDSTDI